MGHLNFQLILLIIGNAPLHYYQCTMNRRIHIRDKQYLILTSSPKKELKEEKKIKVISEFVCVLFHFTYLDHNKFIDEVYHMTSNR